MSVGRFCYGVVGPSLLVAGGQSLRVGCCVGRSLCPSAVVSRLL